MKNHILKNNTNLNKSHSILDTLAGLNLEHDKLSKIRPISEIITRTNSSLNKTHSISEIFTKLNLKLNKSHEILDALYGLNLEHDKLSKIRPIAEIITRTNSSLNKTYSISEIFTKLNLKLNKSYAILEALTGVNSTVSIVNEQYGSNEADINSFSNEEKQAVSDLLDGKSVCYLSPESRKKVFECLGWFYHLLNIIALVCTITGISVPQLLGYNLPEVDYNEKLELLCGKVPELSKLPAEVRETYLDSGSLNIRKYDNKKADVIYQLDNGERFCVISPPKNNAQWLKVAVKTANGDTLIGYVARKYTKKVNYHF